MGSAIGRRKRSNARSAICLSVASGGGVNRLGGVSAMWPGLKRRSKAGHAEDQEVRKIQQADVTCGFS
jgi:hypothetical protein